MIKRTHLISYVETFKQWLNTNYPDYPPQPFEVWQACEQHCQQRIAQLEAKLAEAEKDAERYRWLKYQNADLENDNFVVLAHDADAENNWKKYWVGGDLDNAIDQAIESEKI